MKREWKARRLGDLTLSTQTATPQKQPHAEFEYIDVSSVSNVSFEVTETQTLVGKNAPSRARRLVRTDDVVFATIRPALKRIAVIPADLDGAICSTGFIVLRANTDLLPRFLFYFLQTDIFISSMEALQKGASYPAVTDADVRNQVVPVPPLPEQRRIVAILDEAFEGIAAAKANAERNLRNAKAGFESQLQFVFTQRGPEWGEKPLGQISEFKNGLNYSKSSKGQKLPVVGVADFQDNYLVPFAQLQSATIDGTLADNYAIQPNDILTVRSNGSKQLVGRCMLVGDVDEVTSYSGFIIRIRFDTETIFPRFLLYFMKCQATRDILTAGGGGANITNINQEKLSSLLVPLPPYSDQIAVVALLDSCRAETHGLENVYAQKLAALDELKTSLLHQAFTGQL